MSDANGSADEVSVVYDGSDLRSLYAVCSRCRRMLAIVLLTPVFVGVSLGLSSPLDTSFAFQLIPYLLIGLAAAGTMYLIVPVLQVRRRQKNGWGQPIHFRLAQDGVRTRHPSQDSHFHWAGIRTVVARNDRLFIFTSPACALILPRRCFLDQHQFADWAERAHGYWKAADQKGVAA